MAVKDPTDYDKAVNKSKPPARKRAPKPVPGQSQGADAKGARKS